MKEASGELNMTVITIIAIAAVGALFYLFVWPMIQKSIVQQTCKTYGTGWIAIASAGDDAKKIENATGTQAKVYKWYCCPEGTTSIDETCIGTDIKNE